MSRAERLLELMQCLRRHRHPISGAVLAQTLGVSLRTLYRDIASLQAQGAEIEGEAGVGYVLRPGFLLPPLMFSPAELDALTLGIRWVSRHTDPELAQAANNALAKIGAVLPADLREAIAATPLLVGPTDSPADLPANAHGYLPVLRRAVRSEHKLDIVYHALSGEQTERRVWPVALGFFDRVRVLIAWCETRQSLRHFRVDRLLSVHELDERYPQRRQVLLKLWREREGIARPQ
ncbi:YafY family transcriptional regulator [Pigmentiphaga aceris]|uniref:YafY family transcriptional regulator n=1 Tax=Pigmentiphaga aceris TaxID=1940612 RepID=A0A5C0AW97_9BURK|nr:YafY family protein [Pigmentiphaga aceris]QEI05904.1 YafY family transcriptional regulator [Pigmentiphaga aceris]